MSCTVPLRLVMGGVNAAVVVLVAVVTLGLALSVSLATVEDNARRSVLKLAAASAELTELHFARPAAQVLRVARHRLTAAPPVATPLAHPSVQLSAAARETAGIGPGGVAAQALLDVMHSFSAEADFGYFTFAFATADGAHLILMPAPGARHGADHRGYGHVGLRVVGQPAPGAGGYWQNVSGFSLVDGTAVDPGSNSPLVSAVEAAASELLVADPRDGLLRRMATFLPPERPLTFFAPQLVTGVDSPLLVVPIAAPVYAAGGEGPLLGVAVLALRLDVAARALDSAALTNGSVALLVDGDGRAVAASGALPTFEPYQALGVQAHGPLPAGCTASADAQRYYPAAMPRAIVCRLPVARLGSPVVRRAYGAAPGLFVGGGEHRGDQSVSTTDDAFVFHAPVHAMRGGGFPVDLVVVVPRANFVGDLVRRTAVSIGVSTAVVVLVAVASFGLVWWLLAPLKGLAARMAAAARLEDDQPEGGRSAMTEIADLEDAFAAMVAELNRIRAFVPQSLLRAGSEDEDESEEAAVAVERGRLYGPGESGGAIQSAEQSCASRGSGALRRSITVSTGGGAALMSSVANFRVAVGAVDECVSATGGQSATASTRDVSAFPSRHRRTSCSSGGDPGRSAGCQRGKRLARVSDMQRPHRENVSVLCLNLRGFAAVTAIAVDAAKVAATVEVVLAAATAQKGVVDSFHGDRFIVTFNAARPAAAHGSRAAVTAARIAAAVPEVGYGLRISAGVASGPAHVGNQGCADLQRFSVVGPVVPQAAALERLCKLYPGASCLVPDRLFSDLAHSVRLCTLDLVALPGLAGRPSLVAAVLGEKVTGSARADEWMYALEAESVAASSDPVTLISGAWAALHAETIAAGGDFVRGIPSGRAGDSPARHDAAALVEALRAGCQATPTPELSGSAAAGAGAAVVAMCVASEGLSRSRSLSGSPAALSPRLGHSHLPVPPPVAQRPAAVATGFVGRVLCAASASTSWGATPRSPGSSAGPAAAPRAIVMGLAVPRGSALRSPTAGGGPTAIRLADEAGGSATMSTTSKRFASIIGGPAGPGGDAELLRTAAAQLGDALARRPPPSPLVSDEWGGLIATSLGRFYNVALALQ